MSPSGTSQFWIASTKRTIRSEPAETVRLLRSLKRWIRMDVNRYKQRLIELEATLSDRTTRDLSSGREQLIDGAADAADASVADESESEDFSDAELNATILQQVQDALRRIENGTYGQCLVDGGPIEPKRLDAVPWAPYCMRHQKLLEAASRPKPTL
jgi:RNA polymerase-binding transcription factor